VSILLTIIYLEISGIDLLTPSAQEAAESAAASAASQAEASNSSKKFNFIVMTKKGNKTHYHNMEVPAASDFASQFKAKEEVFYFF
jgi:hypothetical protein